MTRHRLQGWASFQSPGVSCILKQEKSIMLKRVAGVLVAAVVLGAAGCADKPHEYGQQRPPVGELDSRDRGLQSKDVVAASDQMAQDLLADRELNASRDRWMMVVDHVENKTADHGFDMDIFLE